MALKKLEKLEFGAGQVLSAQWALCYRSCAPIFATSGTDLSRNEKR